MDLGDLQSTIERVRATEKFGVPVSLRLMQHRADDQTDFYSTLGEMVAVGDSVFGSQPVRLCVRETASGEQWNVLLDYADGQTASVTLTRGVALVDELHFTLFGNHGVVQLEGAELFEISGEPLSAAPAWLKSAVSESLATAGPVEIPGDG